MALLDVVSSNEIEFESIDKIIESKTERSNTKIEQSILAKLWN